MKKNQLNELEYFKKNRFSLIQFRFHKSEIKKPNRFS